MNNKIKEAISVLKQRDIEISVFETTYTVLDKKQGNDSFSFEADTELQAYEIMSQVWNDVGRAIAFIDETIIKLLDESKDASVNEKLLKRYDDVLIELAEMQEVILEDFSSLRVTGSFIDHFLEDYKKQIDNLTCIRENFYERYVTQK
ncbi:MAG: hypothetical protein IJA34_11795 [Lachnospiraceae bacterium]|nr:hypothetical protein [Lachnospiraceae bacterium]